MSTTGYGDILPLTNFERAYAVVVMLVGVVVSAIVFGVLAQIITEAFDDLPSSAQQQNEVRSRSQQRVIITKNRHTLHQRYCATRCALDRQPRVPYLGAIFSFGRSLCLH